MNQKVREKLKNFKDYDDFLKNFENHREKHEHRSHLLREEGWKDLNDKYDSNYKHFREVEDQYEHKYDTFGADMYIEGYWDSKINTLYYSQSAGTRLWINLKKVGIFYFHIFPLWGLLGGGCFIYNVRTTAKKINVTKANALINC
jgi:hypothetical protein